MTRLRPTVLARLTPLYTGLFAVCGGIVVAVSYILVARLGTPGQDQVPSSRDVPDSIAAQCRSQQPVPILPRAPWPSASLTLSSSKARKPSVTSRYRTCLSTR